MTARYLMWEHAIRKIYRILQKRKLVTGLTIFLILSWLIPNVYFNKPYSVVIESNEGLLLGAKIASDGQWRFPPSDTIPEKFRKCIIRFEDHRYYFHPGIDPLSVVRAIIQNFRARKVVSGASTLTMQVVRLSHNSGKRTLAEKVIEGFQAIKLEVFASKSKILSLYASHAPFGGNVIGIETAAWRYFNCSANQLSWGESAGLAVLPNSPSYVFPGKNAAQLKLKRDKLLRNLLNDKTIDPVTYSLAVQEPLPGKPESLPDIAHHLLNKYSSPGNKSIIKTTIRHSLQLAVMRIIDQHTPQLKGNQIYNAACIVGEISSGRIIAYVGNSDWNDPHGGAVDMAEAHRSTGSILKPFLYASMLDGGKLMPDALVPDLPLYFSGYSPQNFDMQFRGAVPASEALIHSLNIPAVFMLKNYTPARFLDILSRIGLTTLDKDAGYYGLSLILGGGEATLKELVSAYGSFARVVNRYNKTEKYHSGDFKMLSYYPSNEKPAKPDGKFVLRAAPIWQTLNTLTELNRPEEEAGWQQLSSSGRLAWKTGTSFGFRDAWAIGVNPDYVIGVWVGNANGEGRPGLTGGSAAAPILFDISSILNSGHWFEKPLSGMLPVAVCHQSGYRASLNCNETDTVMVPSTCLASIPCPYHVKLHLDAYSQNLVNAECYSQNQIINENWFVLPPGMEYYYRKFHPGYRQIPPLLPGCNQQSEIQIIELIYPDDRLMVFLPHMNNGQRGEVIFQAAHRRPGAKIFWHLDENFIGMTRDIHQISVSPSPGIHKLLIVDESGNSSTRIFKVLE